VLQWGSAPFKALGWIWDLDEEGSVEEGKGEEEEGRMNGLSR